MGRVHAVVFVVAVLWIVKSSQLEDSEISSGVRRGDAINATLTAQANCTEGQISWHYPVGNLVVVFPKTVLPSFQHARQRMKVCFRGSDLGNGVSSITQRVSTRGRTRSRALQIDEDEDEWICTCQCRDPEGVSVILHSTQEDFPEFYKLIIHYKAEEVLSRGRWCGRQVRRVDRNHGGRPGNRRGNGLDNGVGGGGDGQEDRLRNRQRNRYGPHGHRTGGASINIERLK